MTQLRPTPRTTLARHAERGSYDRALVHAIVDDALICHLGFLVDGEPAVLPTAHARIGEELYLHGAAANHMLRSILGRRTCATFTLLDGLVLARGAFNHSMNYRSVVVFGTAREVDDLDEKARALNALLDHAAPGRSREATPPTAAELRSTRVLSLSIDEASAKVRTGDPLDRAAAHDLPIWAGEIPLRITAGAPRRDHHLQPQLQPSAAVGAALNRFHAVAPIERVHGQDLFSSDPDRVDVDYVHHYLAEESYWAAGLDRAAFCKALEHSLCFGVYRERVQIAFARVVTDRARFAYLCDVFVDSQHRGRGLSKALVEFALGHPAVRDANLCLLGTRDAHGLYEKLGFTRDRERFMRRARR